MTINFSFFSSPVTSPPKLLTCKPQLILSPSGCLPNLLSLNQFKTEFLLISLSAHLPNISSPSLLMPSNSIITPTSSARNLGVIFDSTLSMSEHISSVSKSCFLSIRDLRRIRNTLNHTTAHTIAPSLIHSTLDYCYSLFLNYPQFQLNRLQLILNASARVVSTSPQFRHINPLLKSLCWLKLQQRIDYKVYICLSPTKLFSLVNLFISIAFSLFNPTVLLAPLTSIPCNVLQFAHVSK